MPVHEIIRDEWASFLNDLAHRRQGSAVTIEQIDSRSGAHSITWDLALEGITADLSYAGREAIAIVVSESKDSQVTHVIAAPAQIKLQEDGNGVEHALHIKSGAGLVTFLRFTRQQELANPDLETLRALQATERAPEEPELPLQAYPIQHRPTLAPRFDL